MKPVAPVFPSPRRSRGSTQPELLRQRGRTTRHSSPGPSSWGVTDGRSITTRSRKNFSQALGRRYLTVAEVTAWHDYFSTLDSALSDQGIELSIQISPSASSVYPEQLPEWTDGIVGSTPMDQFLTASPDLPIVDFPSRLACGS